VLALALRSGGVSAAALEAEAGLAPLRDHPRWPELIRGAGGASH
jgi:hypothetical protein